MAKNSIRDYDATSGNNTDVQSVDISEGCAASGINNALREIMTDLKNVSTGAVALETPAADQLNVDNIRIDGNTISSTNTNGDISLSPSGTGDTTVSGRAVITGASTTTYDATTVGGQATAGTLKIQNTANDANVFAGIDFNTNNDRVVNRIVSGHGNTTGNGFLAFVTEGSGTPAERLRVDASGNVGIGTSSPARQLEVYDDGTNGQAVLALTAQNTENSRIMFADTDDNNIGILDYSHSDNSMRFNVNNAERMRIDSSGDLLINCTSLPTTNVPGLGVDISNDSELRCSVSSTGNSTQQRFLNPNGEVGAIRTNGSATSFLTSSDYRLKENVADMTGAIARVKQLAPKRFNFIADDSVTVDGFLAHEAQTVVPEAVNGTHNEVDDDGNAVMQGIDQSKLVPLLTGALQEAIAKIETLETQRADLETRLTALENA